MFSEEELIERMVRGEEFALELLFEKHYDAIWKYTLVILKNPDDAREVVNETFFRAFRYATGFQGKGSFGGWLLKIARNLCMDCLNKRKKGFSLCSIDAISENRELSYQKDYDEFSDLLQGLKDEYREIIILKDIAGYTIKEIALILDKSISSVKTLHHRAVNKLRDKINPLRGNDYEL